jgi:hypothetical protein
MTRAQLFDTWAQIVGKPMVRGASHELLVTIIAWHLQARWHGGLTPAVQRKLQRLAAALDRGEPVALPFRRTPTNARKRASPQLDAEPRYDFSQLRDDDRGSHCCRCQKPHSVRTKRVKASVSNSVKRSCPNNASQSFCAA